MKVSKHNFDKLRRELANIGSLFQRKMGKSPNTEFEQELLEELNAFNGEYFPTLDFKRKEKFSKNSKLQVVLVLKEQQLTSLVMQQA